ncbi:hypothetical protein SETIT_3G298900v2 [Setaria italica]|uniref:Uncharacterized protein n=1 Tax=Setaria italica TaxID=4555 RepID=A0A368QKZ8_SETIT|nr:hypothetical protein SETIT_3G298900v2 [Setaria italica]
MAICKGTSFGQIFGSAVLQIFFFPFDPIRAPVLSGGSIRPSRRCLPVGPRGRARAPPTVLPPVTTHPAVPSWRLFLITLSNRPSSWLLRFIIGVIWLPTHKVLDYMPQQVNTKPQFVQRKIKIERWKHTAYCLSKRCKLRGMWQTHSYKGVQAAGCATHE